MDDFFSALDWSSVHIFWKTSVANSVALPRFVQGDEEFGFICLQALRSERSMPNAQLHLSKNKIKSQFVLSICYDGAAYHGFQRQGKDDLVMTVEGDISVGLGTTIVAAGRTDRVSKQTSL